MSCGTQKVLNEQLLSGLFYKSSAWKVRENILFEFCRQTGEKHKEYQHRWGAVKIVTLGTPVPHILRCNFCTVVLYFVWMNDVVANYTKKEQCFCWQCVSNCLKLLLFIHLVCGNASCVCRHFLLPVLVLEVLWTSEVAYPEESSVASGHNRYSVL